jgi:hypothetical protein
MNPVSVIGSALTTVAVGYEAYNAFKAGSQYIHDSMSTPLRKPANNIPSTATKLKNLGSKKKLPPVTPSAQSTVTKKTAHSKLASGLSAGLAVGAGLLGVAVNDALTGTQQASDATKSANDATKASFPDSPFLNNQVDTKQSLDYLIDAINSQSIVIFQGLSPLSNYMEALVVGVQALTDAVLGLDPAVTLPELAPVIEMPTAPAPIVNVSSSAPTVNVSSTAPVVNVTTPAPTINVEAPIIPDYTTQMDTLADTAVAQKEALEYHKTPLEAPDLSTETGSTLLSPRDAEHAKNVHHGRGEADENTIGGDLFSELEDIFDSDELNLVKFFTYTPVTSALSSINSEGMSDFLAELQGRYHI